MPPQTPFILVDNVFDRINLYPLATLSSSTPLVGREVNYIADYRRERTLWQQAVAAINGHNDVDLGVGNSVAGVDSCWFDRGHNLWGHTISVQGSDDAFASAPNSIARVVPAFGTLGGDPTTGWCVTEEGAIYTLFGAFAARRYFRWFSGDNFQPIVTGIVLGKRVQLAGYSNVIDEDAGERSGRSEQSLVAGYSGDDRTYAARMVELDLSLIGATEYDGSIRTLRRLLFEVNQCAVVCMNYGTNPERAWLYKYQGNRWSSPKNRTLRKVKIPFYEYGPLIR